MVPAGQREPYLPLFRLADDAPSQIERYRERGELFGLLGAEPRPLGMVLAVPTDEPGETELVSVAIAEAYQDRGLGRHLVEHVLRHLTQQGRRRALVGTSSAGLGALRFYQRLGFRVLRIERNAFGPAHGYPPGLEEDGVPVLDRVWLDQPLGPATT